MTSIRKRILTILLSAFVTIWVTMMTYTWLSAEHEIEEVFDAQLAQASNVLFGLAMNKSNEKDLHLDFLEANPVHDYEKKLAFQVWKNDELLFRSGSAPTFLMTRQFGYSDGSLGNQLWRFLHREDAKSGLLVVVGEEYSVRNELSFKMMLQSFLPMVIALPVLTFLIILGVNKGLRPLQQLASEVSDRSANQLDSVSMENVPREVSPIVAEINELLKKLRRAIEAERQFTADAAHELRTPLAVVKVQAQVAQRAKDEDTKAYALDKIIEGVDRSSRLVEQLLTLARLDPKAIQSEFTTINISKIVEQSIVQTSPIALERKINISLDADKNITLKGIEVLIETLVINLLKNALIYTPKNGEVSVSVALKEKIVAISVSDSGIGIPKELRDRVFDRFYRVPGATEIGSGLGLSIVKRVVEIHTGKIIVDDADIGGAKITIELPNG